MTYRAAKPIRSDGRRKNPAILKPLSNVGQSSNLTVIKAEQSRLFSNTNKRIDVILSMLYLLTRHSDIGRLLEWLKGAASWHDAQEGGMARDRGITIPSSFSISV
jgi:hypothetical protein